MFSSVSCPYEKDMQAATMPAKSLSKLDTFYRRMVLSKFFTKGWGDPHNLKRLLMFRKNVANRDFCLNLLQEQPVFHLIREEKFPDHHVYEYKFISPLVNYLPGIVPFESRNAYFQMILPTTWERGEPKPVLVQLAGTGDHFYFRRRTLMANPLLKDKIGSILLENPFYGFRKPKTQVRSCLHNVSDIFVMGGCLILECMVILKWCESMGFGPLGLHGISMGGHMASLAATNWPKPIVCVPCLSWTTASSVFTKGVMAESINWDLLQNQYASEKIYQSEISKLASIIDYPGDICRFECEDLILNATLYNHKQTTAISRAVSIAKYSYLISALLNNAKPLEAIRFMQSIMDECTHLSNFAKPYDTSLITVVAAENDAYVPREGLVSFEDVWPGIKVEYLKAGHVSAYVYYLNYFRKCIVDGFERAKQRM